MTKLHALKDMRNKSWVYYICDISISWHKKYKLDVRGVKKWHGPLQLVMRVNETVNPDTYWRIMLAVQSNENFHCPGILVYKLKLFPVSGSGLPCSCYLQSLSYMSESSFCK